MAKPDKLFKPTWPDDELIELTRAILNALHQILAAVRNIQLPQTEILELIMAKLSEIPGILAEVNTRLEEAHTEIVEALKAIGNTDPDISPEGQVQLDKLAGIAKALADLIPGSTTTPPTP